MIKNYMKVAFRNLWKNKGTTLVNLFGLAVGMTCAVLIFLWVQGQLSYDRDQVHGDRIYRLENESWVVMPPWLRDAVAVFPEVEKSCRFYFWFKPVVKHEEFSFTLKDLALVDEDVFEVFNFDFIAGDGQGALRDPYSLVITQSTARLLFGGKNPMGRVIKMENKYDYTITGVVRDLDRFHMKINAFASIQDIIRMEGNDDFIRSHNFNFSTYLLLSQGADPGQLIPKIRAIGETDERYESDRLLLRPLADIYFARNLQHEHNTKHGNRVMVLTFSIIAVLILVVACINFINLTIAKTDTREKEIAVRKVAGALRKNLQKQFFGETVLQVLGAATASVVLTGILLPRFNSLTGEILILRLGDLGFLLILLGVLIFTAFLAGIYPAFYLAALAPASVLKGRIGKRVKTGTLSKMMISFQFVISIALIIAALTVMRQLQFMQTADLGMEMEQVLTTTLRGEGFRGPGDSVWSAKQAFKDSLLRQPSILGVTFVNQIPGSISNTSHWEALDSEAEVPMKIINADPDFVDLLGLEILEGRNFSVDRMADLKNGAILNEEAARRLGLIRPFEEETVLNHYRIIGVVKDFHFNSLHKKIDPAAIRWNSWPDKALIKIRGVRLGETIDNIRRIYESACPGFAMEYSFLDETFAGQYEAEKRLEALIGCFVGVAVLLSCLGLFALTAFVARRKRREISIRKILGSTNGKIFLLLSRSFLRWVLLANVFAWPLAWLVMRKWLQYFPYRVSMDGVIFLLSGGAALAVALLTVSFQALKAASANPADSLKYE